MTTSKPARSNHDLMANVRLLRGVGANKVLRGVNIMSLSMYIKVKGVKGEGAIDILSFSHGVSNLTSAVDREGSAPDISELTITKTTDSSSPTFLQLFTSDTPISTATLTIIVGGLGSAGPTTVFTYTNLVIISIIESANFGGGTDNPVETITFRFEQLSISYTSKSPV